MNNNQIEKLILDVENLRFSIAFQDRESLDMALSSYEFFKKLGGNPFHECLELEKMKSILDEYTTDDGDLF